MKTNFSTSVDRELVEGKDADRVGDLPRLLYQFLC